MKHPLLAAWRSSLSARVLLTSFLFVMMFVAICGVVGVVWVSGRLRRGQFRAAAALGKGVLAGVSEAIATEDRVGAHMLLARAAEGRPDIRYIIALDRDGVLRGHSLERQPSRSFTRRIATDRHVGTPLRLQTELGVLNDVVVRAPNRPELHLGVADSAVSAATDTLKLALTLAIVAGMAVGGVISAGVARWISKPLRDAARATDTVAEMLAARADDPAAPLPPKAASLQIIKQSSVREVAMLVDSFNRLSKLLYASQTGLAAARRSLIQTERMAALGTFVAGTAHAINNPIGGVRMCLEMIDRAGDDDARRTRYIQLAGDAAGRIEALVQRLIHFVDTGGGPQDIAFDALAARTLALNELAGKQRQIDLRFVGGAPDARVRLVPAEFEQALTNVVLNAIQASDESATVSVTTTLERSGQADESVVVAVRDAGAGIPERLRGKVFEPFFTTKPEGEGTGLGLWIVWEACHRVGGEVHIEDCAPGTCVSLRFATIRHRLQLEEIDV